MVATYQANIKYIDLVSISKLKDSIFCFVVNKVQVTSTKLQREEKSVFVFRIRADCLVSTPFLTSESAARGEP